MGEWFAKLWLKSLDIALEKDESLHCLGKYLSSYP